MNPYITHPLTAVLRYALAFAVLKVAGAPYAEWFAFAYVAGFYEGREAGQREHDIKNADWDKSWKAQVWAWFEAEYWIGWTTSNALEAIVAIAPILVLSFLGRFL